LSGAGFVSSQIGGLIFFRQCLKLSSPRQLKFHALFSPFPSFDFPKLSTKTSIVLKLNRSPDLIDEKGSYRRSGPTTFRLDHAGSLLSLELLCENRSRQSNSTHTTPPPPPPPPPPPHPTLPPTPTQYRFANIPMAFHTAPDLHYASFLT